LEVQELLEDEDARHNARGRDQHYYLLYSWRDYVLQLYDIEDAVDSGMLTKILIAGKEVFNIDNNPKHNKDADKGYFTKLTPQHEQHHQRNDC
jgi:hypothetical protein